MSRLFVDGEKFCNALEDTDRGLYQGMCREYVLAKKVKGATAIPRGTYNVIYTYSPRFRRKTTFGRERNRLRRCAYTSW